MLAQEPDLHNRVVIKTSDLTAVEKNGELIFITSDGRFAIKGEITEVWRKQQIKDIDHLKYLSERIDIDSLKLPYEKMNVIEFGEGEKIISLFVDPRCGVCKRLLTDAKNEKEYKFRVFIIPALGDESNELSKKAFCSKSKIDQPILLAKLISGDLNSLEQQPNCDTKFYDLGLMTAHILGIKSVPWIISPDGRTIAGYKDNLWNWITAK